MEANPAWVNTNTTRYLKDLTFKECQVLEAATYFSRKHEKRAGERKLKGNTKVEREEKKRNMLDGGRTTDNTGVAAGGAAAVGTFQEPRKNSLQSQKPAVFSSACQSRSQIRSTGRMTRVSPGDGGDPQARFQSNQASTYEYVDRCNDTLPLCSVGQAGQTGHGQFVNGSNWLEDPFSSIHYADNDTSGNRNHPLPAPSRPPAMDGYPQISRPRSETAFALPNLIPPMASTPLFDMTPDGPDPLNAMMEPYQIHHSFQPFEETVMSTSLPNNYGTEVQDLASFRRATKPGTQACHLSRHSCMSRKRHWLLSLLQKTTHLSPSLRRTDHMETFLLKKHRS
jgi:hypothetical protein